MEIENLILSNLLFNEIYGRKTLPFLKTEYFQNKDQQTVFKLITKYMEKYNSFPTREALYIDLSNQENLSQTDFDKSKIIIQNLENDPDTKVDWLLDQTEKFCQDKAIYNGIMSSIQILDDKSGKLDKGAIPTILQDALAVSFDTSVGHDYLNDFSARYDFYTRKEEKIAFDIDILNKITDGGIVRKSLTMITAGTGTGKSLVMCHMAKNNLQNGLNVLYITLEMSEEKISERIDANILDIEIKKIKGLSKETYTKKINQLKEKTNGRLVVKEYPTSTAGASHFRYLLTELNTKQNFTPDVIYIDYINICASSRMKMGGSVNSYTYIKAIAEEFRGLAVEFDVPVVTATQITRSSLNSSDFELDGISESIGIAFTCDLILGVISTDELKTLQQVMFKQLKNRYGDLNYYNKFVVGIDYSKMRLYDVDEPDKDLISDKPVMDNSDFGERDENDKKPKSKFRREMFASFK